MTHGKLNEECEPGSPQLHRHHYPSLYTTYCWAQTSQNEKDWAEVPCTDWERLTHHAVITLMVNFKSNFAHWTRDLNLRSSTWEAISQMLDQHSFLRLFIFTLWQY